MRRRRNRGGCGKRRSPSFEAIVDFGREHFDIGVNHLVAFEAADDAAFQYTTPQPD